MKKLLCLLELVYKQQAKMFIVKTTKTICMASPKTLQIKSLGEALGYKHVESQFAFIIEV